MRRYHLCRSPCNVCLPTQFTMPTPRASPIATLPLPPMHPNAPLPWLCMHRIRPGPPERSGALSNHRHTCVGGIYSCGPSKAWPAAPAPHGPQACGENLWGNAGGWHGRVHTYQAGALKVCVYACACELCARALCDGKAGGESWFHTHQTDAPRDVGMCAWYTCRDFLLYNKKRNGGFPGVRVPRGGLCLCVSVCGEV